MKITAEEILENRNWIHECINKYISSPRKEKLLEFYTKFDERLTMYTASHKKEYHNAFEGGYFDHVKRVIECTLKINDIWTQMGSDSTTFTIEELVFSALNHDLGKIGDEEFAAYIPQTDQWRKDKLGEDYMFNDRLPFCSVPDRGLFLLQSNDIKYTFNEMLAIQIHDGLYDEANKKYLQSWGPETKLRTNLPLILHQGDLMAAKIEFDKEWGPKLNNPKEIKQNFTISKKIPIKSQALGNIKSDKLKELLNSI